MATSPTHQLRVCAGWLDDRLIGLLDAKTIRGKTHFEFVFDREWLQSGPDILFDPDLERCAGLQYPHRKNAFGFFSDASPDSWGRRLMKHGASGSTSELDILIRVPDITRMGGIRFKTVHDGQFIADMPDTAPPWSSICQLQQIAFLFDTSPQEIDHTALQSLIKASVSLGGGRPKANVTDTDGQLWIAKFPSAGDTTDKAAWEYLAYRLALQSGITMSECKLEHVHGKYRTFFTKRFDRNLHERIHYSSAMTMTGYHEELIRDYDPSYLEIAEFMQKNVQHPELALPDLWRRIVFNIAISNTDDHLRNHGFLLQGNDWVLSPAYDLNPSVEKQGLGLNIDMDNNDLDFDLARSVGEYFELSPPEMEMIIGEVQDGISNWRELATGLNIPRSEQEIMAPVFRPGQQSKREQRIKR